MVLSLKELREEAWGVQNRISGRAGISGQNLEISDEIKSGIYKLTSEQLQMCADSERGYISAEDFESRVSKISAKLKQLAAHLETLAAPQPKPKQPRPSQPEETVELNETAVSGGRVEEAMSRVEPGVEKLDVSNMNLTDADLSRLIETVRDAGQGRLREWNLTGNSINDAGAQRLAVFLASACPNLEILTLQNNPIGESGKSALTCGLGLIRKNLKLIS